MLVNPFAARARPGATGARAYAHARSTPIAINRGQRGPSHRSRSTGQRGSSDGLWAGPRPRRGPRA